MFDKREKHAGVTATFDENSLRDRIIEFLFFFFLLSR